MSLRFIVATVTLAALSGCNGERGATAAPDSSITRDASGGVATDAAFVCVPPDGSTQIPQTFTGTRFDVANGCLTGTAVTLPVCGCFNATGKDSSTWCFSAPDGTTYFTGGNDGCSVEMPPGWYAEQTFGPSPFGTPDSAQKAACEKLAASSTSVTTGTYDRPGPPLCPSDGGNAPSSDAAACIYPAGADTYSDASASGCRPEPGGERCGGFSVQHYLLDCLSGPAPVDASSPSPPQPDPSRGCTTVPVLVADREYFCCPCAT